jgi:protein O-GlcNAc transferase
MLTRDQLQRAIKSDPQDPALHYELGNLHLQSNRANEAVTCYSTALKLSPNHPQVLLQLGNAYTTLGLFAEAALYFQKATQADPVNIAAHFNLGNVLRELGQPEQAAISYRATLKLDSSDADTHNNLGNVLRELGKLDEAIACYKAALRLNPALHHAKVHLVHQKQHICDWQDLEEDVQEIRKWVADIPQAQISPFAFLSMPDTTAAEQQKCAQNWLINRFIKLINNKNLKFNYSYESKEKLRIGYLSGDFRLHPLAFLITELIELHDRSQFEVFAYSYGKDDKTPERKRLEKAFDYFIDIRPLSMTAAAHRINSDKIDILIDLTGFTQTSRSGIAALRPAPINVNWLGFPGTMGDLDGVALFDYLLSDAAITPSEYAAFYSEKLTLLPDCYQPNNSRRPVGKALSRKDCKLPENAFVFCCFNQTFKILPAMFDVWMRLLEAKAGSVLWLLESNPWAKDNLRREAEIRGVNANRLIFASRVPIAEHLARHVLADLFLDTLPYNAHTTCSDALWMGLPVLTCTGETFASRVAGSLLTAANLPEMVVDSLRAYELKALQLVNNPDRLTEISHKLAQNKNSLPLFATQQFARYLEQAYQTMWQNRTAATASQAYDKVADN